MRYNIFDGGNRLELPWNLTQSGRVGDYRVNYAEHHKRRTLEIEKHIDTQSREWVGSYEGLNAEADRPIVLADGDEMATHIFGDGSLIDYVVFHVKREGIGTIEPFIEQDDGTTIKLIDVAGAPLKIDLSKPAHYIGFAPYQTAASGSAATDKKQAKDAGAAGDGNTTVTVPETVIKGVTFQVKDASGQPAGTATGDVTVPARQVDVPRGAAAEGAGAGKPVPYLTTGNGVIAFKFTAAKNDDDKDMPFDTCMGVYMLVKDLYDWHECECAPLPCDTQFPPAVCAPGHQPKSSGS